MWANRYKKKNYKFNLIFAWHHEVNESHPVRKSIAVSENVGPLRRRQKRHETAYHVIEMLKEWQNFLSGL